MIYDLPIEYWNPTNLFNIARGVGLPLRTHPKTLVIENGVYAHVLVDIECSSTLPNKILFRRKNIYFFVVIEYENLPSFCPHCSMIGHALEDYRRQNGATWKDTGERGRGEIKQQ